MENSINYEEKYNRHRLAIKNYVEKNREKINAYNRIRYKKIKEEGGEKYTKLLERKKRYYRNKPKSSESVIETTTNTHSQISL